jgi:hypothetical protein
MGGQLGRGYGKGKLRSVRFGHVFYSRGYFVPIVCMCKREGCCSACVTRNENSCLYVIDCMYYISQVTHVTLNSTKRPKHGYQDVFSGVPSSSKNIRCCDTSAVLIYF